jgi:hypothetical protein
MTFCLLSISQTLKLTVPSISYDLGSVLISNDSIVCICISLDMFYIQTVCLVDLLNVK